LTRTIHVWYSACVVSCTPPSRSRAASMMLIVV
jgi:hypothetical protein